jgi:hypothetical protein
MKVTIVNSTEKVIDVNFDFTKAPIYSKIENFQFNGRHIYSKITKDSHTLIFVNFDKERKGIDDVHVRKYKNGLFNDFNEAFYFGIGEYACSSDAYGEICKLIMDFMTE